MADWNAKHALRNVPQPYKTWLGRPLLVIMIIVMLPYAIVTEGGQWCKEVAGEVADAWREIKDW